jgi:threonyl-tRNA synthetase
MSNDPQKLMNAEPKMTDLERLRHSCAHVLATAVARIWPEVQFAAGPPVEVGFYYDMDLSHRISPEDFPRIEKEMRKIAQEKQVFERKEVSLAEALDLAKQGRIAALGNRDKESVFKIDIIQNIPENEIITLYQNGDFIDLCAGPHIEHTGKLLAFKLTHVASAYYKGDEKNPQLQRIYGTAFPTTQAMDEHFKMLEEAKKRDHRKLGKELELFTFDDQVGPGLPLWMPRGTVLIEELERLAKETEFQAGYQRVRTPHLARESMYLTSGHLPYYKESMFPPMEFCEDAGGESQKYYLKAMNCPHHHKIFRAVPRSYRDLPLRLAEYGTCYRYEQSGELFGLMRVRSMQMNDAHIYCTAEQFEAEFHAVNQLYLKYFKIFGFEKYRMRFSTHAPEKLGQKYVNEPELWLKTEAMVRDVLIKSGIDYVEVADEGAFYGPKIDVQVWSAIGREFTIATNQVDFAVPKRFDLEYTTSQNTKETPICIHRAPLGTHERFIGFLIEHFGGDFPVWLAPEQVRIATVSEKQVEYAQKLAQILREKGVRAELDIRGDKIGGKIRLAQTWKIPYTLILGDREITQNQVSVRSRKKGEEGAMPWDLFLSRLMDEINQRSL